MKVVELGRWLQNNSSIKKMDRMKKAIDVLINNLPDELVKEMDFNALRAELSYQAWMMKKVEMTIDETFDRKRVGKSNLKAIRLAAYKDVSENSTDTASAVAKAFDLVLTSELEKLSYDKLMRAAKLVSDGMKVSEAIEKVESEN